MLECLNSSSFVKNAFNIKKPRSFSKESLRYGAIWKVFKLRKKCFLEGLSKLFSKSASWSAREGPSFAFLCFCDFLERPSFVKSAFWNDLECQKCTFYEGRTFEKALTFFLRWFLFCKGRMFHPKYQRRKVF